MSFRIGRRLLPAFLSIILAPQLLSAASLEEKVREHLFPNGLKLLVVERHEVPTVTAYITLGVGSVDERSDERGAAHLLEHMLFKGTKTLGTKDYAAERPIQEAVERVGGELDQLRRTGRDKVRIAALEDELKNLQEQQRAFILSEEAARLYSENGAVGFNAFTSKDLTTYLVSLPANKLELWAVIEADRMKYPVLREFYTEREVVKEERRRSYESNPDGLLYETLLATAFTVHPYRHPIIGWMPDLEHLGLATTRQFLTRYYGPVNTVITLVGDVTLERAVELVGRYFGDIPAGTPVPAVTDAEPRQRGERRAHIVFDAEPKLKMAFHKPTLPERSDYVFDLLAELLGEGRTSRLYRSLVIDGQLASDVSVYGAPGSRYPNLFVIAATPRAPHTTAEVERAITAELDRLASTTVSVTELDQARTRLQVDRLRQLRDNEGLARMLSYYQTVAGDWRYLTSYDQAVATITPDEVQETVRRYLSAANRTVVTLGRDGGTP